MSKRKNILFLLDDQHRGDCLSWLGHPVVKTPNLDKLAARGVTFTNAYTPSAICQPSRTSMVTGKYPTQHQILQSNVVGCDRLPDDTDTYLKRLQAVGYKNVLVGKWHAGSPEGEEHLLGLDEALRVPYTQRPPLRNPHGWMWYSREYLYGDIDPAPEGIYPHDRQNLALGMYRFEELLQRDEPWYLNLSLLGPHDPYYVTQEMLDLYPPESIHLPENWEVDFANKPAYLPISGVQNNLFKLSEDEARAYIRHYYAYISTIDAHYGEVLDKLARSGQEENTVVVFASDHGDHAGDFRLMGKERNFYESIARIPLIIADPGSFDDGSKQDAFANLLDLPYTFCDIAGAEMLPGKEGASLYRLLENNGADWHRDDIFMQGCYQERYVSHSRMLRFKTWKFAWYEDDLCEVYDLENDPGEMTNLIRNLPEGCPFAEMQERLAAHMEAINDPALPIFRARPLGIETKSAAVCS